MKFGSLQLSIFPTVYEPAEDSFLLANYASVLAGGIRILDMGCGCGIAALASAKADSANRVLGADINPAAVACSSFNARANKITNCSFIQSNLFSKIPKMRFDAILFNPPYLPLQPKERMRGIENKAYDGGKSGTEVILKFCSQASRYLEEGGHVAIVASSLADGIEVSSKALRQQFGNSRLIAQESFFFEKIALIEAVKYG